MPLHLNLSHAHGAAQRLYHAFHTTGIHHHADMPEDILPGAVEQGSLEHILFITLTVAIDYQRDAEVLWRASRLTYRDPETRYLFSPKALAETPKAKVERDMQKYKLSQKQTQDAWIWQTIGTTLHKKYVGDPRLLLKRANWSAPRVLELIKKDTHPLNGKPTWDFPFLRGPKIGPLWLRMLRDNAQVTELRDMDKVPIPVDVHVARASLALGVVRGSYKGPLEPIYQQIRQAWFEGVRGLETPQRPMMALDVDTPLWTLSRYGCTDRDKISGKCIHYRSCELREFCIPGKVIVDANGVELDT